METITASEARANFAEILGRVSFGKERITIERSGKPVALLVPVPDAGSTAIDHDITERKRAEERFRRYFDLPLVGSAIYAPDKKWIAVNDTLCNLLGYSREELMEITWPEITHPDDLAENLRLFEAALSGTGSDAYTMDKRFIRKDGGVIRTMICAECVRKPDGAPDYFLLLVQDITERCAAEEALRDSQSRLVDAIESFPGGFVLYDAEERLILSNSKYREFYPTIAELLKPGVRLSDVARISFEAGDVMSSAANVEALMKQRLEHNRTARETMSSNSRTGVGCCAANVERRTEAPSAFAPTSPR